MEELGIHDSRVLYDWMSKMQRPDEEPLFVLDSDDLVEDPTSMLTAYCKQ